MLTEKKPDNFQSDIHDQQYRRELNKLCVSADTLIMDNNRGRESLDGFWKFTADPYDTCLRAKWWEGITHDKDGRAYPLDYDFDDWETIKIPSCWNTFSDLYKLYEGPVTYTRTFDFDNRLDERVYLRFGAAYHDIAVYINHQFVGFHKGGDTPFNFDVTDILQSQNRIICVVNNARTEDRIPTNVTDWFNYGGIYRSVDLIRVPDVFISDYSVALIPKTDFKKIKVQTDVICFSEKMDTSNVKLQISELGIETEIPIQFNKKNSQGAIFTGEIVIDAKPELWSPENPKLYNVILQTGNDEVRDKIGFREIIIDGLDIKLNGKSVYFKGISCHEESVLNGKALTEEEVRENFELIKEANGNFIRLAHYPHHERSAKIADEIGLMVWEEIPVYWSIQFTNPETIENGLNQLEELIRRDKNRASVVVWSIGNENPDTDERLSFMAVLAQKARELDSTRLISAACLWDEKNCRIEDRLSEHLDIIGINEYYGWYNPNFNELEDFFKNSKPNKPVVITEFGGGAVAGHHGTRYEMFTEENQAFIYKKQTETIAKANYVKGCTPWILYDFRIMRRLNKFQKGYNRKGLLNEDKTKKKPAFFIMQNFFGEIWGITN